MLSEVAQRCARANPEAQAAVQHLLAGLRAPRSGGRETHRLGHQRFDERTGGLRPRILQHAARGRVLRAQGAVRRFLPLRSPDGAQPRAGAFVALGDRAHDPHHRGVAGEPLDLAVRALDQVSAGAHLRARLLDGLAGEQCRYVHRVAVVVRVQPLVHGRVQADRRIVVAGCAYPRLVQVHARLVLGRHAVDDERGGARGEVHARDDPLLAGLGDGPVERRPRPLPSVSASHGDVRRGLAVHRARDCPGNRDLAYAERARARGEDPGACARAHPVALPLTVEQCATPAQAPGDPVLAFACAVDHAPDAARQAPRALTVRGAPGVRVLDLAHQALGVALERGALDQSPFGVALGAPARARGEQRPVTRDEGLDGVGRIGDQALDGAKVRLSARSRRVLARLGKCGLGCLAHARGLRGQGALDQCGSAHCLVRLDPGRGARRATCARGSAHALGQALELVLAQLQESRCERRAGAELRGVQHRLGQRHVGAFVRT